MTKLPFPLLKEKKTFSVCCSESKNLSIDSQLPCYAFGMVKEKKTLLNTFIHKQKHFS